MDWVSHCLIRLINKKAKMSRVKTNRSLNEIDLLLQRSLALLDENIAKGNYVEAENCRVTIEQMKKEKQSGRIRDLQRRHEEERHQLALERESQTKSLFMDWENRLRVEATEAERAEKEMLTRHVIQQERTKESLEMQSPTKVKQSPECLNLRKQQACMVKQKNYAQAHIVQKQIAEMERAQKEKWMASRKAKIELALKHLVEKQENELVNLKKNIKAALNENRKLRERDEEKLNLKFTHLETELTMKQEKEKIAHRGEFTSKGGEGSPLLTKSRLLKSRE